MTGPRIVTVDGTAGSGKTTLGRALATELELPLVDTGLFYRGVMVGAVRAGIGAGDVANLIDLARRLRFELVTDPAWRGDPLRVDGRPAGDLLRDPRHSALLSALSSVPEVRTALLAAQRALAGDGAVAVGRDCGTVVFADAPVKLYLEAPHHVRVERRAAQLQAIGDRADRRLVGNEVGARDDADAARSVAPLRPAPDAVVIDTGDHGLREMVATALELCRRAGLQRR